MTVEKGQNLFKRVIGLFPKAFNQLKRKVSGSPLSFFGKLGELFARTVEISLTLLIGSVGLYEVTNKFHMDALNKEKEVLARLRKSWDSCFHTLLTLHKTDAKNEFIGNYLKNLKHFNVPFRDPSKTWVPLETSNLFVMPRTSIPSVEKEFIESISFYNQQESLFSQELAELEFATSSLLNILPKREEGDSTLKGAISGSLESLSSFIFRFPSKPSESKDFEKFASCAKHLSLSLVKPNPQKTVDRETLIALGKELFCSEKLMDALLDSRHGIYTRSKLEHNSSIMKIVKELESERRPSVFADFLSGLKNYELVNTRISPKQSTSPFQIMRQTRPASFRPLTV